MRVVHWNTHHGGIGSDGKWDVSRLADALAALAPDVVSLNEVEQFVGSYGNVDQVETIRLRLGSEWVAAYATRGGVLGGKAQVNVLLSKTPMTKIFAKGLQGSRSVVTAQISNVTLYSTHIDNESASLRNVQANQQLCWHKEQPDPRVICGDFNAQPTSVELASWFMWYKDAWTEAKKLGTATAFNTSGATKSTRIDYIFFRGLTVKSCEVPDTRVNGVFPSDHHPVVAVF